MANPWPRLTTTTGLVTVLSLAKETAQTRPRPRQTATSGILNSNPPPYLYACSRDPHTMANLWCHVSLPRQDSSLCSAWLKKPHRQSRVLVKQQKAAFRTAAPLVSMSVARLVSRDPHTMANPWCHVSLPRQDSSLDSAWLKKPHRQGHDPVKQQQAAS